MNTRRDFVKKAMLLSGAAGWSGFFPESIARAASIDPAPGSTYADAEHVVILMQENRSFDHCFGTMKGVRGFNDPRYIHLPNGNPVWLQSSSEGETYAPFRFDIRGTKVTWMGSTPHGRHDQVDANNGGKYDRWVDVKRVRYKGAEHIPMTMGYYTREDVPFNYALADAFTVCDQNYCSAMTSTWPNRYYLWSGTIRDKQSIDSKAYVRNSVPWGEAHWTTFPELLEKNEVSWKVYQNDISAGGGFVGAERNWLSNFGCNPLEFMHKFNVRFSDRYVAGAKKLVEEMPEEIARTQAIIDKPLPEEGDTAASKAARKRAEKAQAKAKSDLAKKKAVLAQAEANVKEWSQEAFGKLSPEARNLYEKAFVINRGDPDFRSLVTLSYEVDGEKREVEVPKGDVFHQFRTDVNSGKLPAVSWLVGPASFSDHPSQPWYGSWYVSEVIDILTKNPEVWKKTVFILTYDENDGYFDHIPPYVAPDPARPDTGKCSPGIDSGADYIRQANEIAEGQPEKTARSGPIGLGYRVPMIIASPWSRGGRVCSQVFDHTSVFRFVQDWVLKRMKKEVEDDTITAWRKTVCGDLTSAFRPFDPEGDKKLSPIERDPFIRKIYDAKFMPIPSNSKALSVDQVTEAAKDPLNSPLLPKQEPGIKPSCALPYQLYADAKLSEDGKSVVLRMESRNEIFGKRTAGSPFNLYLPGKHPVPTADGKGTELDYVGSRSYAVVAGGALEETLPLSFFKEGEYHLCVHGPNGFHREHKGSAKDPALHIECDYERDGSDSSKATGKVLLRISNSSAKDAVEITIADQSYKAAPIVQTVAAGEQAAIAIDTSEVKGWYDFSITAKGFDGFSKRCSGRVETGADSITDPFMGKAV